MGRFTILTIVILVLVVLITAVPVGAVIANNIATNRIDNDYESVMSSPQYSARQYVEGVALVTQEISCGYAVIEMLSSYLGGDITEESLMDEYGEIVTSSAKNFERELNKRFNTHETTMYKYLSNVELLDKIYHSLDRDMPVPIEWAAKANAEWTLHYSLVIGIDVPNDSVVILNPYGEEENITLDEFFSRTTFRAYEPMPAYLTLAFAFGAFEKNTIFIID